MEHVNNCCFRDIYKGGLWEDDLYVCGHKPRLQARAPSIKPILRTCDIVGKWKIIEALLSRNRADRKTSSLMR